MRDDINRFVETAAILDAAGPARERVIEAQRVEIAKLNQIIAILVEKVESFSALVCRAPVAPAPPLRPAAPVKRPAAPVKAFVSVTAVCARCRNDFETEPLLKRFCRSCRNAQLRAAWAVPTRRRPAEPSVSLST